MRLPIVFVCALFLFAQPSTFKPDPPITCSSCDVWNGPHAPFKVFGNTYWVGVAGLSSMLIASDAGHILLDGGLPQSAALIDANLRALGFRTADIRLIVNSHAHYDHAGGIAALQRASGATVAASASGAAALERGEPGDDDPQFGLGPQINRYPAVKNVKVVRDGDVLRVAALAITAHLTPGHTPGSTTWTWQACDGPRCLNVVYADSLNAVSAPGFRFTGDGTHPDRTASFRASVAKIAALPCDIVFAVHPAFADMDGKLERRARQPNPDPFIDPHGCRTYAADAARRLEARVAEEQAEKKR
jgi:metallo-beta-lactamase class B